MTLSSQIRRTGDRHTVATRVYNYVEVFDIPPTAYGLALSAPFWVEGKPRFECQVIGDVVTTDTIVEVLKSRSGEVMARDIADTITIPAGINVRYDYESTIAFDILDILEMNAIQLGDGSTSLTIKVFW
jgi:hypothetical protein